MSSALVCAAPSIVIAKKIRDDPVHIPRLPEQAKKFFLPMPTMGLIEEIQSRKKPSIFLLQPTTDLQSQQMVGGYIEAIKDDLKNGGYIFVKKSRAADVLRQLAEAGAAYKAVQFEQMSDIAGIVNFDQPGELWVIIEDDGQPLDVQASRFKVAETELRKKMAPDLGLPVESDQDMRETLKRRKAMGVRLLMFIEMDYPSVKGFNVVLVQARGLGISTCRVTRRNAYDDEVARAFNLPERHDGELKSYNANSIRVFGSGPKNYTECSEAYEHYKASLRGEPLKAEQIGNQEQEDSLGIDLRSMRTTSNQALVLGFGYPLIVDASK